MRSLVLILKKADSSVCFALSVECTCGKLEWIFFLLPQSTVKKTKTKKKEENARTVCMTFCDRMPVTAKILVINLIVFVTVRASKTSRDVFLALVR